MTISNFIGSIIYFQRELNEKDLCNIKKLCKEFGIDTNIPKDVVSTYLELYDPNNLFDLEVIDGYSNCRIYIKKYDDKLLKYNYFDKLTDIERNYVYKVVNRL